jgi:hypothetical protein
MRKRIPESTGDAIEPTNVADVPRLLFLAAACRLWLREYTTLRTKTRRRAEHKTRARVTRLPSRPNRWDWTSSGAPVMR